MHNTDDGGHEIATTTFKVIGDIEDVAGWGTPSTLFKEEPSASPALITYTSPIIASNESETQQSPTTFTISTSGDEPGQLMVYIYSIHYRGEIRLNSKQLCAIKNERDMNYNYTGSVMLNEGNNSFDLHYQTLPDSWMTKLQLKVYRYDWNSGTETVYGKWTCGDP